ncbi:hypothetical protein ACO2I3_09400 [Leptospira interrogans]
MHARRPIFLLTGFGSFPGVADNATTELVPLLARAAGKRWPGYHFEPAVLPTEWHIAPQRVAELIAELRPAVTLHFGVSSKATGFTLELRGQNLARALPDAAGCYPTACQLAADGPEFLPTSIPVIPALERLRRSGLPAVLSRDAGGYLCNAVLYAALDQARGVDWPMRSGFVHLPASLSQKAFPASRRGCALTWGQTMEGSLEIIAATLGRPANVGSLAVPMTA